MLKIRAEWVRWMDDLFDYELENGQLLHTSEWNGEEYITRYEWNGEEFVKADRELCYRPVYKVINEGTEDEEWEIIGFDEY